MPKEIDEKLYDIDEIYELFNEKVSREALLNYFDEGRIIGKKIENQWYAKRTAIDNLMEYIATEKMEMFEKQTIELREIILTGRVLDIGGGGEGVIGQLKGENVVAIDLRKDELESGFKAGDIKSLKIIMDATDLKFIDNSFATVTAFFSMMYMKKEDLKKAFEEIFRILNDDGDLIIWDLIIPNRNKDDKDFIGIYLDVDIGEKIINTGYATQWVQERNMEYYLKISSTTGFKIKDQKINGNTFNIRCSKT